jgi:hypothetical protein
VSDRLRPMTLAEILDRALEIYRRRFGLFLGLAFFPALASSGIEIAEYLLWGPYPRGTLQLVPGIEVAELAWMLGFYHFSLWFQLLVWPVIAAATSETLLGCDEEVSITSSLNRAARRWKGWAGMSAILLLLILVIPEVTGAAVFIGTAFVLSELLKFSAASMEMILPPFLILVSVAAWLAMGWMSAVFGLAIPSRKLEGSGIRAAIRRGRKLSRRCRLKMMAAWAFPALTTFVLELTVTRVTGIFGSGCPALIGDRLILFQMLAWKGWCLRSGAIEDIRILGEALVVGPLIPVFPIALTLFYYDQRIRQEAFDIEQMMEAAGMNATAGEARDAAGGAGESKELPA